MAQELVRCRGLIGNAESLFVIRDASYDPSVTLNGAIEDSQGQLAGSNGRLIVVQTTSAVVQVAIDVQSWSARPGNDSISWEATRDLPLWSHTGAINIEQLYNESPPDLLKIPLSSGPGNYTVQICLHGRAELDALLIEIRQSSAGLPFAERAKQERRLNGVEGYRIRIWPNPPGIPD